MNALGRRAAVLLCATLLPGVSGYAQVPTLTRLYEPAARPPGVRYQVLESKHFQIIFQQGAESEAREAAALLEGELPRVEALIGHGRGMQMPVVLNAFNDRSNGLVSTLPFRQEIEAAGITANRLSARYTSWMQAVVPHELVHAAQAHSDAGFGVGSLLRLLSPDLARSLNLGLPPGLNEGAAVYHESTVQAGAGRLNYSLFQMKFRAAMASGKPWSLAQILEFPAYSFPADRYYIGGANLFAKLAKEDGGAFFRAAKAQHYRLPLLGTGVALWRGTGKMPHRLGREFRRAAKAEELARQVPSGPVTEGRLVATGPGRSHRRPQWLNDSTVVAHVRGYDVRTGFYRVDMESGALLPIAYEPVTGDAMFSLSDSGKTLLFSRYVRDRHVASRWVADAFELSLDTGRSRRLTRGQRVLFPVPGQEDTWAIQNQGQFTAWVRITDDGKVASASRLERATLVQIVPSPEHTGAAVILRREGRQGIYRAAWTGDQTPSLEPWIVFQEASVYDASWHGPYLLFTADLHGVSNVFAAVDDKVMQLTDVLYGAMEPSLSPDCRTLAFVEYQHERFDLRATRFDLFAAKPIAASQLLHFVPPTTPVAPFTGGEVKPYRALQHLRPRTLLPAFLDSGNGTPVGGSLGIGPGITVQGADPLRVWAYALGVHHQAGRMWYSLAAATDRGGVRADLELFTEPGTAAVVAQDHTAVATVGQEYRGMRVRLSLPVYMVSSVRSTAAMIALDGVLAANRLFALPGKTLPRVAPEWQVFRSRLTLGPYAYMRYRITQNTRDLMPDGGTAISISADVDLWDQRAGGRQAAAVRVAQYMSLSQRAHAGMRIRATLVAQSAPWVYNLEPFAPQGYASDLFGERTYAGIDGLIVQPLWFVDDGFVLLPLYFKVLYAYAFAEAFYATGTAARYRSIGAGLGVQFRLLHYLDLELRLGRAYLVDARRFAWTLR